MDAMTDKQLRIRAAELMGWTWGAGLFEFCNGVTSSGAWCAPVAGDSIYAYAADTKDCVDDLPDYLNDISAAWGLADELESRGHIIDLFSNGVEGWACEVDDGAAVIADTAPRAITKAFIAAMEADD